MDPNALVELARKAKQMRPGNARQLIRHHPGLSVDERDGLLAMLGPGDDDSPTYLGDDVARRFRADFEAAAYMLGATLGQLAGMFEVSTAAIHAAVDRRISKAARTGRRKPLQWTHEELTVLYMVFMQMVNDDWAGVSRIDTLTLAAILEDTMQQREAEQPESIHEAELAAAAARIKQDSIGVPHTEDVQHTGDDHGLHDDKLQDQEGTT